LLRHQRTGAPAAQRTWRGTAPFQRGITIWLARRPGSPLLGSNLFSHAPTMDQAALRRRRSAQVTRMTASLRFSRHRRHIAIRGFRAARTLVKDGSCWWYRKYAQGDGILEELETRACSAPLNLWTGRFSFVTIHFVKNSVASEALLLKGDPCALARDSGEGASVVFHCDGV
jgi:hypothetical protein